MREREHRSGQIQRGLSAAVLGAVALAWGLLAAPGNGPSRGSGPGIASVIPEAGPVGTAVVVRGDNFGPSIGAWLGTSEVSFNGTAVTPSYWSDREIRAPVPVGASSGPVVVTVNGRGSDGVGFAVTASGAETPEVASVSPEAGPAGTEVVVRGENFGPASAVARGTSGVSFSGVWGRPSYWSDREIRVAVPPGAPGGQVVVAAGGLAGNGVPFRVTGPAPVIGTVDPNHGPAGTELVIRGMHFGSPIAALQGAGRVSFNGTAGTPSYWSDGEIRVAVPVGAESGLVVVTAGGSAGNGVEFTVTSEGKGSGGRSEDWAVSVRSTETAAGGAGPEITSLQP
ncbi:MAG: IPT/TIG domain-containing protein [Acidobacteriota bacterium]|nr:IPT/TIG domain-containing protein [Acidobacteriota bacterium]